LGQADPEPGRLDRAEGANRRGQVRQVVPGPEADLDDIPGQVGADPLTDRAGLLGVHDDVDDPGQDSFAV